MFFYQTCPIDFWMGTVPIDKVLKQLAIDEDEHGISEFLQLVIAGIRYASLAKGSHWEGDIRANDFYVFGIPDPDAASTRLGVAWKQDNNGTTFIFSPIEIPWITKEDRL